MISFRRFDLQSDIRGAVDSIARRDVQTMISNLELIRIIR